MPEKTIARISSSTISKQGHSNSITISNLSPEEREAIEAMMTGTCRLDRVDSGEIVRLEKYKPLSSPTEDPKISPYWKKGQESSGQVALFFDLELDKHDDPAIIIQHLCAYNWSEDSYKGQVEKLESYGFICLRSRRDAGGKYWEIWYLPSIMLACGELKDTISRCSGNSKRQTNEAIDFLCRKVSFGTLDVSLQKAATHFEE